MGMCRGAPRGGKIFLSVLLCSVQQSAAVHERCYLDVDYLAVAPRAAHFSVCLSLLVREKKVNAEVFDQMVSRTQHTGYLHSELLSGLGENQISKFVAQVAKLSSFSFTLTSLE